MKPMERLCGPRFFVKSAAYVRASRGVELRTARPQILITGEIDGRESARAD